MSADNFVVVRKRPDGYWWGSFSASQWWDTQMQDVPYPDSDFTDGPYSSEEAAEEAAEELLGYIEYGFEPDKPPG